MTVGVLLTAFSLGLRHGIDWDHIAAISDLHGTAPNRRRGFVLSLLYAVGHAAVVFVLGALAIVFGAALPESVGDWMGRVVGATLIALGSWVLIELIRQGRDFRLRSRWMLVFSGTFAGLRRVRQGRAGRRIVVDHGHGHEHEVASVGAHDDRHAHDHSHLDEFSSVDESCSVDERVSVPDTVSAAVGSQERHGWWQRASKSYGQNPARAHNHAHNSHTHAHSHELVLPETASYSSGSATGIGILHGIGVESPTQIAVFAASSAIGGAAFGLLLLLAWVVGLVVANSAIALLAGFGLLHAERNFGVYATVAVFVGVASIAVGGAMVAGYDLLPAIDL